MDPKQAEELLTDSLPYSKLYVAEFLLPILPEAIIPNILYSDSLTNKFRSEQAGNIVTARGLVRKDDLIVAEGELITPDVHQKLASFRTSYLEKANGNHPYLRVFLGYILLTGIIIGVFILYLQVYAREIFHKFNHLIFVLMWMVVYSYLVFAVDQTNSLSAYIIPFCIVPIVVKIFYTDRLAFFTHIVVILIASFLSSLGYEFTILQILAGIVAVLSNPDARDWSKFFKSMLYIYLTYAVAHTGLMMIHEGEFILADGYFYIWIFLNVFLTLLAYPLIPLLERLFGFTSSISLMELSDMNRPLLRELALQAPGTLQHSLQVANLSEAAAQAIGADQLLVKVAALYHDIGKTKRPEYFIENQSGNNPHNDIGHMESAKVIIDHVVEGAKMAKKYRLPKVLIDFIMTHHGTTRVEYFYRLYVKDNPEKEFDEQIFRYPGPKPVSKEQTILMIADSLEAASKSLKNPTGKDIDDLVNKIIAGKISLGQLDDSKMTFEELEICKNVFRSLLRSINHVRVEYPEEPKTTEVEE
jgi:putative nucleotidyltransferase with HDIG domain